MLLTSEALSFLIWKGWVIVLPYKTLGRNIQGSAQSTQPQEGSLTEALLMEADNFFKNPNKQRGIREKRQQKDYKSRQDI